MNNIYNSAIEKLQNKNATNALAEISRLCNKETFDTELIEILDKHFSHKLPNIETLYNKNLQLIKDYQYIYEKNITPIEKNPNRCYIIENHLIYLFIAKDFKFVKVDISSKAEVNKITKTITPDFELYNVFNLALLPTIYPKTQTENKFGHYIISANTKKLNFIYLHYDTIEEFSLLLYIYDLAFLKQLNRIAFLIGKDNRKLNINQVSVIRFPGTNLGDTIGPMIVDWMLKKKILI